MKVSIRLCGLGGQGVILSSVLLGQAAVVEKGLYVSQTQSYGSEARGGQCQSELMISDVPILTPNARQNDILIAMFQTAYNSYISSLKEGGSLYVDSELVKDLHNVPAGVTVYKAPFTQEAIALGSQMAANMVMLGYFVQKTGLIDLDHLKAALRGAVKKRWLPLNMKAVDKGAEMARD